MTDFGNVKAQGGRDRCWCGCKYWEGDLCIDCGTHVTKRFKSSEDNPALADLRDVGTFQDLPMLDRVRNQSEYLADNFGFAALNDGIYTQSEIAHAVKVLDRYLAVFGGRA